MPKVSVIIPAYNHAHFVVEALESVLQQSYQDFEVIVVNDGSTDSTGAVLLPFIETGRIRYILQDNQGVAAARNTGLAAAKGEFIAFLDDDDIWPADKLEWQVPILESSNAVMIGGSCQGFSQTRLTSLGINYDCSGVSLSVIDFFAGNPFTSPGQTLIRKSALESVGGCNTAIWGVDDLDLWIRLSKLGQIVKYEHLALHYRLHERNASLNLMRMALNAERVILGNLEGYTGEAKRRFEFAGYRFLFRYSGKKLLWKGAQLIKLGQKEQGWRMINQSITMFRPRFRLDVMLLLQFILATLKIPFKMGRMR